MQIDRTVPDGLGGHVEDEVLLFVGVVGSGLPVKGREWLEWVGVFYRRRSRMNSDFDLDMCKERV